MPSLALSRTQPSSLASEPGSNLLDDLSAGAPLHPLAGLSLRLLVLLAIAFYVNHDMLLSSSLNDHHCGNRDTVIVAVTACTVTVTVTVTVRQ